MESENGNEDKEGRGGAPLSRLARSASGKILEARASSRRKKRRRFDVYENETVIVKGFTARKKRLAATTDSLGTFSPPSTLAASLETPCTLRRSGHRAPLFLFFLPRNQFSSACSSRQLRLLLSIAMMLVYLST